MTTTAAAAVPARPSATIVLLRDAAGGGIEVLLLRRADRGDQNSLRWVFPGGLVDATDRQLHAHVLGPDDATASRRLGVERGGLDFWAAALRETLEEAGLLLACDAQGAQLDAALHREALRRWREESQLQARGEGGAFFAGLLARAGWRLPLDAVLPIARWITPLGMPKRFDTFFFVAAAPAGQQVQVDGQEVTEHLWASPEALMVPAYLEHMGHPTKAVLQALSHHASAQAALAWARDLGPLHAVQPRLARDARSRLTPVPPWHPAYAEVGRIDPQGRGLAWQAIRPGEPVELVPDRLVRLTANNGSAMTGPGTNTYALRAAANDWVLIDPGPDDDAHVRALRAWCDARAARVAAILVTHTHVDHSPAAQALRAATGAPLLGRVAAHAHGQDAAFVPDRELHDGQRLDFGGGCVLRVVHTPGHASNHLCFLHGDLRLLFTGDHVMQGSTVVINPPDGDMRAYLDSLARLAQDAGSSFDALAPGHGFLIEQPADALARLIAHRRRRGARVAQVLGELGDAALDDLLPHVYDDVPIERHAIARRSLLAHLIELQQGGRAREAAGRWQAVA